MNTSLNSLLTKFEAQNSIIGLRILFVFALLYTIFITAWIGDDAQITFRQIWNFIDGNGITFNFQERVQAFTHPLWFLILSGISFFTKELFLTAIIANIFFSVSAIFVFMKIEFVTSRGKLSLVSPLFLLLFSWSYIDYATSGLENALSNFLVSLVFYLIMGKDRQKHVHLIYTILALLVLNRLDYSILFLPLAVLLIFEINSVRKFLKSITIGLVLLLSWHLFAIIYFGSPFSNTFYAKMNAEIPIDQVINSGWNYIKSLSTDFSTLIIIISGIILSIISKNKYLISLSLGQILYLLYILSIGGDFMLGRFFTILVFISVGQIICSVSDMELNFKKTVNKFLSFLITGCLINGLLLSSFPIFSGTDYRPTRGAYLVGDERGGNYRFGGLFSDERDSWPKLTSFTNDRPSTYLTLCSFLGGISNINSSKYVIDLCALSDAFLARIPPISNEHWVSGHYTRKMPTGYGEFLVGKIYELPDKKLNGLLKDVQLAITGNLFTVERWRSIWRLNTNYHNKIDFSDYTNLEQWIPRSTEFEKIMLSDWDQNIKPDQLSPRLHEEIKYFNGNLIIQSKISQEATGLWFFIDFSFSYNIFVNDKLVFENVFQDGDSCNGVVLKLATKEEVRSVKFTAVGLRIPNFSDSHRIRFLRLLNEENFEAINNQNCTHSWDFKPY